MGPEYGRWSRPQGPEEHSQKINRHVPVTAGEIAESSGANQHQESMDLDFLADMETMAVMAVMDADSKSYRREHRRAAKMVLSKI